MKVKEDWQKARQKKLSMSGDGGGPSISAVNAPCPHCGEGALIAYYYMVRWIVCVACGEEDD